MSNGKSPNHKEEQASYQVDDQLQDGHTPPKQVGHQDSRNYYSKPNHSPLPNKWVIDRP